MNLSERYKNYIGCLNRGDLSSLDQFVCDEVVHNGRRLGLEGYREMLASSSEEIPDLHFHIEVLVTQPPYVAAVLLFDCHPKGQFLGLDVNGRRVLFAENVFYRYSKSKIQEVWSVIDKHGLEESLNQRSLATL